MVDLTSNKIDIKAKNGNPQVPTDADGGNISYRDSKINILVSDLEDLITDLEDRITALESASSGSGSGSGSGSSGSSYIWTGDLIIDAEEIIFTLTEDITIEKIIVSGASDIYSLEFYTPSIYFDIDTYNVGSTGIEIVLSSPTAVTSGTNIIAYTAAASETGITVELVVV